MKRLLVTGASGLLGSDIAYFAEKRGISTIKTRLSHEDGFLAANLSDESGIKAIADEAWDCLIHCAAWRNPEQCENDPEGATKLNSWATGELAKLAAARNAKFLYVSTDYVFPGTNPPHFEDSTTRPVNYYGQTKLEGEKATLDVSSNHLILRIPFLYGIRAGLDSCPMLVTTLKGLDSEKPWPMEDSLVRYPTFTGDVAEAALFLLEREESGVFHFSGQDKKTRYTITETVARVLGKPMTSIQRLVLPPQAESKRPPDAHLAIDKILSLGFPEPKPFEERITILMKDLNLLSV